MCQCYVTSAQSGFPPHPLSYIYIFFLEKYFSHSMANPELIWIKASAVTSTA